MTSSFCIFDLLLDFFLADLFGELDVGQEPVHYSVELAATGNGAPAVV